MFTDNANAFLNFRNTLRRFDKKLDSKNLNGLKVLNFIHTWSK